MIDVLWSYLGGGLGVYLVVTLILLYAVGRWAVGEDSSKQDKVFAIQVCFSWPLALVVLPIILLIVAIGEVWQFCAKKIFAWFESLSVRRATFTHEDRPSGPYRTSGDRDD